MNIQPHNSLTEIKVRETDMLRQWATLHGRMIPADEFTRHWVEQGYIKGAKHHVYFDEAKNRVIKRNHLAYQDTWLQYFQRMAAHNFLVPSAPYVFEGLMEVTDNARKIWLFSVVSQRVISARRGSSVVETGAFMKSIGYTIRSNEQFYRIGVTDQKWDNYVDTSTGLLVNDLHCNNILMDYDGCYQIIDPWIELSSAVKNERLKRDISTELDNPLGWLDRCFGLSSILADGTKAKLPHQQECRRDLLKKLQLALLLEPTWLQDEPLISGNNALWMQKSIASAVKMPRMTTEEFIEQVKRIRDTVVVREELL